MPKGRGTGLVPFLLSLSLCLFLVYPTAYSAEDTCLTCHGVEGTNAPYVDPQTFSRSVHGSFGCAFCHPDAAQIPHPAKLQRADPQICARCHAEITKTYEDSIHGKALARGEEGVANCSDCHGIHDSLLQDNPESRVFPFNLPATCGKCHSSAKMAEEHNIPVPQAYQSYMRSVHGSGLYQGLLFSATCKDCHGVHDIEPVQDPRSLISPRNLPLTCGKCHMLVLKDYQHSVHGKLWEAGSPQAPVCDDCHRTHAITSVESKGFELASIGACGNCHPQAFKTYRGTYHGQVSNLGYTGVAKCSDCHDYHNVLPSSDPESSLSPQHIVATCQACHPKANANFVKFIPHADPRKASSQPWLHLSWVLMTILLSCVFGFFGLHTMLWAIRGYLEKVGGKE